MKKILILLAVCLTLTACTPKGAADTSSEVFTSATTQPEEKVEEDTNGEEEQVGTPAGNESEAANQQTEPSQPTGGTDKKTDTVPNGTTNSSSSSDPQPAAPVIEQPSGPYDRPYYLPTSKS